MKGIERGKGRGNMVGIIWEARENVGRGFRESKGNEVRDSRTN